MVLKREKLDGYSCDDIIKVRNKQFTGIILLILQLKET